MFPSPIGELHFSIFSSRSSLRGTKQFPSPIGELHFSIFSTKYGLTYFAVVSVPYRGATFLNIVLHILDKEGTTFPSPIGELHFSMKCLNRFSQMTKFPSPIGELHFSIIIECCNNIRPRCFRPLSGSYISQWEIT